MHNSKVDKEQSKYRLEVEKKKRAKEQGITLKELEENEACDLVMDIDTSKKKKFGGKKVTKKDDFEIVIKMKDTNGEILDFDMQKALAESYDQASGHKLEESKSIDPMPTKIEAEDTLDMIQKALGGSGIGNVKVPAKKKTVIKKKIIKKKEPVDTL
jgi:hypothetical protein